ncbi:MAG: hypothetical protein CAF45_006225 [Nitrospira sp. CG24E]|nr:MAG: hypothetical protein CAF45_006225 [Nitrospira sp. CG24E]
MSNLWHTAHSRKVRWAGLSVLCLLSAAGCAQPVETIEMTSFDPSQDQAAIVGYYREAAMDLREKAAGYAESAVRYEHLFGPESDWVSGARKLSQYYAESAQELERLAEAHAKVAQPDLQKRQ